MMKKGLIFDLDGTLLDSMKYWEKLGEDYLKGEGVSSFPYDFDERLKTMSLDMAAQYFIDEFHVKRAKTDILKGLNSLIEDRYLKDIPLKKGVCEFLEKNSHLPMCIATANDRKLTIAALKRLGAEKYFKFIITVQEISSSKESAEIYIKAAEGLGLAPACCIVFEDSLHGVRSAKNAGFKVVAVKDSYSEKDIESLMSTADMYVENLNETEGKI